MNTKAKFEGTASDSKFFTLKSNLNDFERIIYHCPDCYNLPTLTINEDLVTVNCTCNKNHNYNNVSIEEFHQKLVDTSFSLESLKSNQNVICFKCKTCLEIKDSQGEELEKILHGFGYCSNCDNIICYKCLKNHDENEKKKEPNKHKVVPLDKYTNYCPLHKNKYSAYCFECKINTCIKCTEHRKHKKYHFDEYLLYDEDVNKYKKQIIDLRTNCENLENKINSILDKIRSDFHEEMKKQINILTFNELLLDAYQTNQYNYFYLQNILNNFNNLENVEKNVNNQDEKQILINLINGCDLLEIEQISKINNSQGELLHVSQPTQITKQIKALDYNKDTVQNPNFQIEGNKTNKNNNIILEMTNDSKGSSMKKDNNIINKTSFTSTKKENEANDLFADTNKSIKSINNETNRSIKNNINNTNTNNNINNVTNTSIEDINNVTNKSIKSEKNKSKKSIKTSIKKENSSQTNDDLLASFNKNNNIGEEIDINDIIINQSTKINNKISCEFIGKNFARESFKLNDIPNNIEVALEIKNTGNVTLPKGCYLFDENNCSSLMILDNVINSIDPGKSIYKQLKFDIYIYNKGSYNVKLVVKDPNGAFISSNKFEYTLIIE